MRFEVFLCARKMNENVKTFAHVFLTSLLRAPLDCRPFSPRNLRR